MLCPKCGSSRTKVVTTSISPETTVTRVRRCDSCESSWATLEVPVPAGYTEYSYNPTLRKPTVIRQFCWWLKQQAMKFDEAA